MTFRLNGLGRNLLSANNQALSKIAQARVNSDVARAVKRHENALKVDGSHIYMWIRGNTGLICTCRQPNQQLGPSMDANNLTIENLREPLKFATGLPAISKSGEFKVITRDSINASPNEDYNPNIPKELLDGINADYVDELNDSNDPLHDELKSLSYNQAEISDQRLATMLSEGSGIYGGDKTACGICFGTGKNHGYELATGRRLLLDATNEYPFMLNGASIKPNTYPHQFYLSGNATISWVVDLPSYTNNWLNFTVRDNLNPARGVILEWYYQNKWKQLTLTDLSQTEGTDRRGLQFRVRLDSAFENATFTHCEIIYSTAAPLLGQAEPFNVATDFEVKEPIIMTEFEILANISDIPRESVFQDSKYKYLWKVRDVTAKMTEQGQIFSLIINARMVHRSEMLYALKVIFDPLIVVNYRGLELEEGGIPGLNTDSYFEGDSLTLTIPHSG